MERIDKVPGTEYDIIQNKGMFSYGVDAILLSSFARAKGIVVDLGTGTGIIPLRLVDDKLVKKIYGVEIQDEVYNMAKRSVTMNSLDDRIEILHRDLRDLINILPKASVDVITCNPPYMKSGGAIINDKENFALSRHELKGTLEDILEVASYLLKPRGKLYMVHRPNRLVDVLYHMRECKIEPKFIRFVHPKKTKNTNLFLIEGHKGANKDFRILDPLYIYNEDGSYTDEIYEIYEKR